ncbi:MAG TPA: GNAT family N-acetyltransferase [Steroidobacteraceae bacterium]|nr:GNAT family N-acetyltransferase [Steroidobacteraceae bacterium]
MPAAALSIRPVREPEVDLVLAFIRELAQYERLADQVSATPEAIARALFGPRPCAEAVFGCIDGEPCGFALFFHNFSTFLGKPGLYLEDLYVRPAARGRGLASHMLAWLARLALERGCGRFEWAVLDWNEPALRVYRGLGARAADDWTIYRLSGAALADLAAKA